MILESEWLQLTINAAQSSWILTGRDSRWPILGETRLAVKFHWVNSRSQAFDGWQANSPAAPETLASPHGPLKALNLTRTSHRQGLTIRAVFALPQEHPFALLKLSIENTGPRPVFLERIELLNVERLTFNVPTFFSNGWQSWNYSGAYRASDRFQRTRLGFLSEPLRVNPGTPHPHERGHFGSDMFGVLGDRASRVAWLCGFLSQKQHFGSLEAHLQPGDSTLRLWANGDSARLDPGASIETDWACFLPLDVDAPDPLAPYIEAAARENHFEFRNSNFEIPLGWCSWYHFFQRVTAGDVRANLQAAAQMCDRLSIELIQLDDGFEAQVGDWFSFNEKFPQGVAPLAAEIREAGFTPGLWLAPFIVHPRSQLARDHPDWLLRGRFNRPVNAGFIWNVFNTALDLTIPEALEYACRTVHTAALEWGFSFLKLDFLYAAALPGRYRDPTRTRAQVLRAALEALRQSAGPQTMLLGCGCPLGPAIGLVEAMRIGSDVDVRWCPAYRGIEAFFRNEPDMPSARNSVHNALTRAPLHGRWWANDPDCLLLRPTTRLTLPEVQTLATATALTDGSLLLSDDLPALPAERLRIAEALVPLLNARPQVIDWFDSATPARLRVDLQSAAGNWHLLAQFNWADTPETFTLDPMDYHLPAGAYAAREFWSDALYHFSTIGGKRAVFTLPAHGVALLATRPMITGAPQYLGSDLHLSQGLEVTGWQTGANSLALTLQRPGPADGSVFLRLPWPPGAATLEGEPLMWQMLEAECYRFPVMFAGEARLSVS